MKTIKTILDILKDKKSKRIGLVVGIIYFLFYLYSIGNIAIVEGYESFSFKVADNWQDKIFKVRTPYIWESIAAFHIYKGLSFFLSIPNLIIALLLAFLVFLNIAIAAYSYSISKVCQFQPGFKGLLGFLPSFFTGFACCVPTFLIALGPVLASFTIFFIKIRQLLIPFSFFLMIIGIIWSTKRIPSSYIRILEKKKVM